MTDLWILLAAVLAITGAIAFRHFLWDQDRDFLQEDDELIEALHGLERIHQPRVPAKW